MVIRVDSPAMLGKIAALFLLGFLVLSAAPVRGDDADPVSAFMAPTYISIGYDVVGRLNMFRQTLAESPMTAAQRQQANAIVDEALAKVNAMIGQMQNGPMPSNKEVTDMPAYLEAQQQKISDLLGPAAGKLETALASPRGQTRLEIDIIAAHVDQLKLDADPAKQAKAALDQASAAAAKLPSITVTGADNDQATAARGQLLATLHDQLAAILSPDQQDMLGQHFAQAQRPAAAANAQATGDPATRPVAQP